MADKEVEAAALAQTRQPQQQQAAVSYFGPSLVNKQQQQQPGASSQKAALDSQPRGYYQNVTQKAKLILPTALWILIVVAGLCFLSLLSSLNETINTLNTVVELEQARAANSQAASGERSAKHGSPLSSAASRRHHHDSIATAAASSAEAPTSERLLSAQSKQDADDPEGSGDSDRAKVLSGLYDPTNLFAFPSWTSLEPRQKERRAEADSVGNLLNDMLQAASGESRKNDKFIPVGGSITIASSSSADDPQAPSLGSMMAMIDSLFGASASEDSATVDGDKRERLFKLDPEAAATKDNKAGSLITANIDRVNINVNMPAEEQRANQQPEDSGVAPAWPARLPPMQMVPIMNLEEAAGNRPEQDTSLDDLLGAIVNPAELVRRQPEDQGGLFMSLLPPPPAAPEHHKLLSGHRLRSPQGHRVPSRHHHHQHRHHLPPLDPPLSLLSSVLLGPPPMLDQQQADRPQAVQRFVITLDDDNNDQSEAKQQSRPSGPVNSPYEFMAPSTEFFNPDQMILPFFGGPRERPAKHHQRRPLVRKNEENNHPPIDLGGQEMSDELANQLIKSLFPTRETSEQNDQNSSSANNEDHPDDEIVVFGADLPYFSDKKQSLAKDEPGANDDGKQVSELFDLLFGQQQNSRSTAEPQIALPKINLVESTGITTKAPSNTQAPILPFEGTQRPASTDPATPPTAEITSLSIGPHEQSSSATVAEEAKAAADAQDVSKQQELSADFRLPANAENLVGDLLNSMISMPQFGGEREPMRAEAQSSGSSGSKEQQVSPLATTPMPEIPTNTSERANITVPVGVETFKPSTTTDPTTVPPTTTTTSSSTSANNVEPTSSTANETIAATSADTTRRPAAVNMITHRESITSKPTTMISSASLDKLTKETTETPISAGAEADKKPLKEMLPTVRQPGEVDVKQQSTTQLIQSTTPSPLSSSRSDQASTMAPTITSTVTPSPAATTTTMTPTTTAAPIITTAAPITTTMTPAQRASPATSVALKDNGNDNQGRSDKANELKKATQAPAAATVASNTSTTPTEPPPPTDSTSKPLKAFLKKADEFIEKNLFNFRRFLV